ncbi:MAG TPA: exodeoxyribonuclease V subunit alpha [Rhodocyclaceae bacterium]
MSGLDKRLQFLVANGALADIDLHFARAVAAWGGDDEGVVLAAALLSHLSSSGHVCADLPAFAACGLPFDNKLTAPEMADWLAVLKNHGACGGPGERRPLVLDGERLYLHRHWQAESAVAADLARRSEHPPTVDEAALSAQLDRLFAGAPAAAAGQRTAVAQAARSAVAVISGGPGTGKTTTLAALLAVAVEQASLRLGSGRGTRASTGSARTEEEGRAPQNNAVRPEPVEGRDTARLSMNAPLHILLAAPTGKAAARMEEAVRSAKSRLPLAHEVAALIPDSARTLHRLLGIRPDGSARHDRDHPLHTDLLVVDEASMVDLSLMARLLDALPETARLVLLGDRDQLASVEAGAVFADLCASAEAGGVLAAGYGRLNHSFRFGGDGGIGRLARLLREGDGEGTLHLLLEGAPGLAWHNHGEGLAQAALAGYGDYLAVLRSGADAAKLHRLFAGFRLLAAHREGPAGIRRLNGMIEDALGISRRERWYPGRPVMVTVNDYGLGLFNGDIGITAADPASGELQVWFVGETGLRAVTPARLPAHETAWAMTVHKSQGSEFDRVLLVLPEQPSPLVTRELVYTAVTRAKQAVELRVTERVLRDACERRIARHSGLAQRLGA